MKGFFRKIFAAGLSAAVFFSSFGGWDYTAEAALSLPKDGIIAKVVFGRQVQAKGATAFTGDNSTPVNVFEQGREAWKLDPATTTQSRYIYVDIDDDVLYNTSDGSTIEVTVEYFDAAETALALVYPKFAWKNLATERPSYSAAFATENLTELDIMDTTATNTWRTHTWVLERAWLNNSVNGADFRFGIHSTNMPTYAKNPIIISSVTVRDTGYNSTMNIGVESQNLGHMFYTGEKMKFDITIDNSIAGTDAKKIGSVPAEITYTLTNSKNHECGKVVKNATIGALQKYKDSVEFDIDTYDLYKLRVDVVSEKKKVHSFVEKDCSYVMSAKGDIVNPRAGVSVPVIVNSFTGSDPDLADKYAKIVRNAGYKYVRINTMMSHTSMSSYDHTVSNETATWTSFSEAFQAYRENGLSIMMYATPKNANPTQWTLWPEEIDGKTTLPYTQAGRERFLKHDMAILNEHAGSIDIWEIGNEPNIDTVRVTDDSRAADAAAYDSFAYPLIKEAFPDLRIGTTQISGFHYGDPWYTDYFNAGGVVPESDDFISFHPYTNGHEGGADPIDNNPMNKINGTRMGKSVYDIERIVRENGFKGELWATEYGKSPGWYGCPQDEFIQGMWNVSNYINMTENNIISKMIIFRLEDSGVPRNNIENTFGMIRPLSVTHPNRMAAKPGYLAESAKNHIMYDAEFVDKFDINSHTVGFRYKKTKTNKDMFAMFTNRDVDITSVDLGVNKVTLYDMYGNATELVSNSGVYTFSVTVAPFYCVGDFKKFEILDRSDVYPLQTEISAVYNGTVEVEVVNNTEEILEAKLDVDGESTLAVEDSYEIKPGISKLEIHSGSRAVDKVEQVGLTVKGNKGIMFDGYVALNFNSSIQLDTELKNDGGIWKIYSTVSNSSDTETVSGQVELMYPYNLAEAIKPVKVSVAPGESTVCEMIVPEESVTLGESLAATLSFVNEDGKVEAYNTETMFFVYAPKAKNVKIDGELSEWKDGWMYLNSVNQFSQVIGYLNDFRGPSDLWTKIALKWDDDYLYFAAEVHDDTYFATGYTPEQMWNLDNFQIGVLYDPEGRITAKSSFEEISFANLEGKPTIYRNKTIQSGLANPSQVAGAELAINEKDGVMYYEARFPWTSILPEGWAKPYAGSQMKFSALLNENDGHGRKGFYELGSGIGNSKDSTLFMEIFLYD